MDRERRVMTAKMLAATQNSKLISKLCCSRVRLLVHRFIFSMLLGKYSRYICCRRKYSSKLCLFGKKMIWCLALNSKNSITKKQQHKNNPLLSTHTEHKLKFSMTWFQYLRHSEKSTQIFYKTIRSCVIVDFIVED